MKERTASASLSDSRSKLFLAVSLVFAILWGCSSGGSGSNPSGYVLNTQPTSTVIDPPPADTDPVPTVLVETNQKLTTSPHLFDVYRASNADKAIIFLHGAQGNKHHAAYQFGINLSDLDAEYGSVNEQTLLGNKALTVFPQGQAISTAPEASTWSNYVTDSGQNDMAFLRDLVGYIREHYGISRFSIVGHSTGGMMANRIWCEDPDLFDSYIAIAGPPSVHFFDPSTLCQPGTAKPYLGIVRSNDAVLGASDHWDDQTWTINQVVMLPAVEAFLNPVVISERNFLKDRASMRCGDVVADDDAGSIDGVITTWSFCSDFRQVAESRNRAGA